MLEGTDARIHYVYYTPEIEGARNRGGLRTNSFIQLRKSTADSRPMLEIDDMGDSEALFHDKRQLRQIGQRLIRRGMTSGVDGSVGIKRRFPVTILETPSVTKQSERSKNRDLGR